MCKILVNCQRPNFNPPTRILGDSVSLALLNREVCPNLHLFQLLNRAEKGFLEQHIQPVQSAAVVCRAHSHMYASPDNEVPKV